METTTIETEPLTLNQAGKTKKRFARVSRRQRTRQLKKRLNTEPNHCIVALKEIEFTLDELPNLEPGITIDAVKEIVHKIGFLPRNLMRICAFNEQDEPAVLQLYPLNSYEDNNYRSRFQRHENDYERGETLFPFPTIFWLMCPNLNAKVAQLEEDGQVQKLLDKLLKHEKSKEWLEDMKYAHEQYKLMRWSLLTESDKQYIQSKNWVSAIQEVGIAGIRNVESIKCLHCHYAHFLAKPEHRNIVGQWVHELLQQQQIEEDNSSSIEDEGKNET